MLVAAVISKQLTAQMKSPFEMSSKTIRGFEPNVQNAV